METVSRPNLPPTRLRAVMNDLVRTVPHPLTRRVQSDDWTGSVSADVAAPCETFHNAESFHATPSSDAASVERVFRLAYAMLTPRDAEDCGSFTSDTLCAVVVSATRQLALDLTDCDRRMVAAILDYASEC